MLGMQLRQNVARRAKFMQVKEKHVTLPLLCSCPHDLSPLSPQYPHACAINCPLYENETLYKKLLQSLLFNYDLEL